MHDYSEDPVDVPEGRGESFLDIADRRYSRRDFLRVGAMAGAGIVALAASPAQAQAPEAATDGAKPAGRSGESSGREYRRGELKFDAIDPDVEDALKVAAGYVAAPLISWGDPVVGDGPAFDIFNQSADEQEKRHGFNCDFLAFMPLRGSHNRGLLWVNHEYTDGDMMFPDYDGDNPTEDQVNIELAAHGASIIEVERQPDGQWRYLPNSKYNRRVSARSTMMHISGPAAGDDKMKTAEDPTGTMVIGMLNNCGGGVTPWGTILTAEENFHQYFAFDDGRNDRFGVPTDESGRKWERYVERFDLSKHPNSVNRYGWMVEVDPYDPDFTPVKRTALGRFKHEACTVIESDDGYAVAYSGDDERFDYVYKWVSNDKISRRRKDNIGLLDNGTLYVAKFNDDGTGEWLPVEYGRGPINEKNGFVSQADVLIRTREAADLLGATPMDRPEDVETNPVNKKLYIALTNNTRRTEYQVDGPNPRAENAGGHVVELDDTVGGQRGTQFTWDIFLLCGDPEDESTYFAGFDKSLVSPIANPDNLEFDRRGDLWIATDGAPRTLGSNDAIHAVATEGPYRGQVKQFFSAVPGAEVASLVFDTMDSTLFASVQHPNEGGTVNDEEPASTFPDGGIARPTVVAITREKGRRPIAR